MAKSWEKRYLRTSVANSGKKTQAGTSLFLGHYQGWNYQNVSNLTFFKPGLKFHMQ